jgi:putative transposase
MARQPRFFVPGVPLHVIQRGNNRARIFVGTTDYRFFLDCLVESCRLHGVAIHAYVLMTNHVHLLATPQSDKSLSRALQSVGRRYVGYFNHFQNRTGTLWEGRYRAAAIDSERYFLTCMRYVEQNPVRAGLARHCGDYRWSSHLANATGTQDPLVTPHYLYEQLGRTGEERQSAYRLLFESDQEKADVDIDAIREATHRNWALGRGSFVEWIQTVSGRKAIPSRRVNGR